ncbi:MAG: spore cortex-lytic enzyme SleB [Clostridia bacterium]|nr:spore cortex-lytic enzyme SleB [Clostridia bacterium]
MKKQKIKSIICKASLFILMIVTMFVIVFGILDLTNQEQVKASNSSNTSDVQLLARAINGEARGEPYEGQVAVGAVILNRVKDSKFPNTIAGVIYQSGAFTAVADGQINVPIKEGATVVKAAQDALNGWDPTDGAIYYFNPATATNKWIWSRPLIKTIGKHRFCR